MARFSRPTSTFISTAFKQVSIQSWIFLMPETHHNRSTQLKKDRNQNSSTDQIRAGEAKPNHSMLHNCKRKNGQKISTAVIRVFLDGQSHWNRNLLPEPGMRVRWLKPTSRAYNFDDTVGVSEEWYATSFDSKLRIYLSNIICGLRGRMDSTLPNFCF